MELLEIVMGLKELFLLYLLILNQVNFLKSFHIIFLKPLFIDLKQYQWYCCVYNKEVNMEEKETITEGLAKDFGKIFKFLKGILGYVIAIGFFAIIGVATQDIIDIYLILAIVGVCGIITIIGLLVINKKD